MIFDSNSLTFATWIPTAVGQQSDARYMARSSGRRRS
jgi:hypothetical protein